VPDFERAVDLLDNAREVRLGLGPSEFVAQYLALRLGRMGRRARASGITGFRLADELIGLTENDLVVLLLPGRHLRDIEILLDHNLAVSGKTLLITDSLATLFADEVTATLPAMHSPSNFTGEMLAAEVVTDAMLLALAACDEERATDVAELLTSLRSKLIQSDSHDYVHRSKRAKS
jgi:DNA-binding MurR/RpiR family transcriptional regulator